MAPLAGKPPFATDEPDTFYESQPQAQRRARPPPPPNPNARTSAYNVYDNYLTPGDEGNAEGNRQSGVGALGMGLLNMADSDDDSDDESPNGKRPKPASKNAALAAATGAASRSLTNPFLEDPKPASPPTIAAPRPGYAAPIAALNLANSEPVTTTRAPPAPAPIAVPTLENPFEPPMAQVYPPNGAPLPSPSLPPSLPPSSPHPLQPSITPITPVFARPAKAGNLTFSEPIPRAKPIMRGGTEGTLLPRRGEKGDDFWRRFSMVAKIENGNGSKESWWLKKTRSGTTRLSRWVWVIAIALVLCIVAASIIGWKVSQSHPSHQAPEAIGGSANERPESESAAASATGSSIKHVTPTHTVARRVASITGLPYAHTRAVERRKRLFDSVIAH